jgi:hypothetical protein
MKNLCLLFFSFTGLKKLPEKPPTELAAGGRSWQCVLV